MYLQGLLEIDASDTDTMFVMSHGGGFNMTTDKNVVHFGNLSKSMFSVGGLDSFCQIQI